MLSVSWDRSCLGSVSLDASYRYRSRAMLQFQPDSAVFSSEMSDSDVSARKRLGSLRKLLFEQLDPLATSLLAPV